MGSILCSCPSAMSGWCARCLKRYVFIHIANRTNEIRVRLHQCCLISPMSRFFGMLRLKCVWTASVLLHSLNQELQIIIDFFHTSGRSLGCPRPLCSPCSAAQPTCPGAALATSITGSVTKVIIRLLTFDSLAGLIIIQSFYDGNTNGQCNHAIVRMRVDMIGVLNVGPTALTFIEAQHQLQLQILSQVCIFTRSLLRYRSRHI